MKDIGFNNTFYSIIDAVPASIYWKDIFGKYLGCNKYMAEIAGLSKEEIIGKTDDDLIGKDAAAIRRIDQMVTRNKTKHEVEEVVNLSSSNEPQTFLSTKIPVYDSNGEVTGVMGVSVNITERKKTEKEVTKQVSHAIKMISACIAHEVRTPLSIVNINADRLQMELSKLLVDPGRIEQKNKIRKFVDNIKFGVKSGNSLISMLLIRLHSIFNKTASEEDTKFDICSIKQCINNAIKEYPFYDGEQELITWDEERNQDFVYRGNDLFTKHALFNLIKNALRSTKEVNRGKIYISLHQDKDYNYLFFKDTASGIPTEAIGSLFQQFNIHSKAGTGLGLAFCKITMQSYGGDITCQSQEGEYTEFVLKFPVIQ